MAEKRGDVLIEGKTKLIYSLPSELGHCLICSKDQITAEDGAKSDVLLGKSEISTDTLTKVFTFLQNSGIGTHFVRRASPSSFVAKHCEMIPIEFVARRLATGSFLKRNPGVPEGYRFCPPKIEYFYKDDAAHDPQWSYEQLICSKVACGLQVLTKADVDVITKTTQTIFEVLERAWSSLACQLIDFKVEFGFHEGEILLADVIDNDSWRLWPQGKKHLMLDKQLYRDMQQVNDDGLNMLKQNFRRVASLLDGLEPPTVGKVAMFMGSVVDEPFCLQIKECLKEFGMDCEMRVSSAHKSTEEVLRLLAEYEAADYPVVLVVVAGRSNGLGPMLSANTCLPVINCPPLSPQWGSLDVWSSLRLPSGLGCCTVLSPDAAAQLAAQILASHDHRIWSKLRVRKLNAYMTLRRADAQLQSPAI